MENGITVKAQEFESSRPALRAVQDVLASASVATRAALHASWVATVIRLSQPETAHNAAFSCNPNLYIKINVAAQNKLNDKKLNVKRMKCALVQT